MSKHPIQTGAWWKAALIRALKTWAQTLVALLGTDLIGVTQVDWVGILSVGAVAAILSILTSIAGLPEVPETTGYVGRYRADTESDPTGRLTD